MEDFVIKLSKAEELFCLKETANKLKRIIYIYEQSLEDENYDYRQYVYAVILYISSFNSIFEYGLSGVIVNLNSLLINDLDKKQIRKIALDSKRTVDNMISKISSQNN